MSDTTQTFRGKVLYISRGLARFVLEDGSSREHISPPRISYELNQFGRGQSFDVEVSDNKVTSVQAV